MMQFDVYFNFGELITLQKAMKLNLKKHFAGLTLTITALDSPVLQTFLNEELEN
jgi:hypothetical protein